jgi:hypothetical protein
MKKAIFAALAVICTATSAYAQHVSADDLENRTLHRRAVEAVIWGMPAVNYDLMLQEMLTKTPGKVNEVIYWGRPLDWKNQTLTPNPDTLYFMTFLNTKDVGPIVIDIPPSHFAPVGVSSSVCLPCLCASRCIASCGPHHFACCLQV